MIGTLRIISFYKSFCSFCSRITKAELERARAMEGADRAVTDKNGAGQPAGGGAFSPKPMKLQSKMILLIVALLLFVAVVGGLFSLRLISTLLESQIGSRALRVSQAVANIPQVRKDLEKGDLAASSIQEITKKIRIDTGAQFIVVGDRDGMRYSHTVPERIGHYMVGGDNHRALEKGLSYISKATGTLGPSIRGKVPVLSDSGEVIGIVSVGYLMEDVKATIRGYQLKIVSALFAVILLGIGLTIKITSDLKKAIFGLEPEEIATLLQEKTATLEAVREGIMAIDDRGCITTVNQAAFDTLGLAPDPDVIGKPVQQVFPGTKMLEVLESGKSQLDKVLNLDEKEIIVNRLPIILGSRVIGVVSSFRDKSELDSMARKLYQVQKYSEMLRAQTHEYSNKLHTISGLIQIGGYQEAIELIGSETTGYQKLITSLMTTVPDPVIAGTILGKYNKAKELKIEMVVDPDSSMDDIPPFMKKADLVTIIGNILDNAFEAVLLQEVQARKVRLSMTDLGNDLIFEFDDSGPGIDQESWRAIFSKGFTTKHEEGHGMGLYLVEKTLNRMGGSISVGTSELGGTAFTVIIPKSGK